MRAEPASRHLKPTNKRFVKGQAGQGRAAAPVPTATCSMGTPRPRRGLGKTPMKLVPAWELPHGNLRRLLVLKCIFKSERSNSLLKYESDNANLEYLVVKTVGQELLR